MTDKLSPFLEIRSLALEPQINVDAILALETADIGALRQLSLNERGKLFVAACHDAARVEASRRQMGLPGTRPAPWPDSTWNYLAEWARRARERS